MCGFVGIASISRVENRSWLTAGRDVMHHRGPDDAGEWWSINQCVGMGHRRLAIVDLSSAGHQPMQFLDAGLTIVFNGEIYNHKELRCELQHLGFVFCSNSDTEVLLAAYAAWGESCLSRLNGMFAFALYDSSKQFLFLARDRAGEKPLFYRLENGTLQFASELKALLVNPANSRLIDAEALDCYLAIGYVPGDRCILKGYNKLPPAHLLRFNLKNGQAKVRCYWQLPDLANTQSPQDETALLDELEVLLKDAVGKQVVADVPVGVLLSGGVDSSLVTAMAAQTSTQVHTFTISFPGYGKLDESMHARLVARHFDTLHTELVAEDASVDLLPSLARQFDEPMVDSSMIPTFLISKLIGQHCKVALGGDGGDELFGGYTHYSRLLWMQKNLGFIPPFLRRGIALSAESLLPVGYKGRNWAQGLGTDLSNDLPLIGMCFEARARRRLLKKYVEWPSVAESVIKERIHLNTDLLERATRTDFSNYLAEDILVKVDRASMLSSLEIRAPLLDYRLIEFAYGKVPSKLKASPSDKKILLKRLATRLLPSEFDQQRKQGFSIPLAEWLKKGAFGKFFNEVLRDPQCSFDIDSVDELLQGQARGRNNGERLFALVLFELWRREYKISF